MAARSRRLIGPTIRSSNGCAASRAGERASILTSELPEILILAGPTAVGKTEVSISVARALGAEIVSADSRQVYRDLQIGTAKPTPEQRKAVLHHVIDFLDPRERYNAQRYGQDALAAVSDIRRRGRVPLVVGGTGFYIEALMYELSDMPPVDPDVEARLSAEAEEVGVPALHERLAAVDPESAETIEPNDRQRTLRALAVYESSGRPISHFRRGSPRKERVRAGKYVVLTRPRQELYARIDARVEGMVEAGLVNEAERMAGRYGWEAEGLNALGYKEFRRYFEEDAALDEAIELLKRNTRRYAKRQLTWFRRVPGVEWLDLSGGVDAERELVELFTSNG